MGEKLAGLAAVTRVAAAMAEVVGVSAAETPAEVPTLRVVGMSKQSVVILTVEGSAAAVAECMRGLGVPATADAAAAAVVMSLGVMIVAAAAILVVVDAAAAAVGAYWRRRR